MTLASSSTDQITLTRHLISLLAGTPQEDLILLVQAIQAACKSIGSSVRRAGIDNLFGLAGCEQNVQGEDVKKLDVLSNEYFVNACSYSGKICAMVSEETTDVIPVDEAYCGPYVICFDPLDGSTNIDASIPTGSIFSIFRRKSSGRHGTKDDCLQPGRNMVAAGFAMYSAATVLLLSVGKGVQGYTLDPATGEFILSHPTVRIPSKGTIYSVNEGNHLNWSEATRKAIATFKSPDPATGKKPYSLRYVGSFCVDMMRTLLYGGIFAYPDGKLRLLYECNPMAFLVEQAGGLASTGREHVLDVQPKSLHQRVPIFIGSAEDVKLVVRLHEQEAAAAAAAASTMASTATA